MSTQNPELPPQLLIPILLLAVALAALTWMPWLRAYAINVGYVRAQPYEMALWLRENTPSDAVIAVHDVGMMRYVSGRTTLDMVGLTTPGAAAYWRQGPGAVGQFLAEQRPDYIASYGVGHGLGLGFLAATDLYGEPLAEFGVELDPQLNVALAAPTQGIYRPVWEDAGRPPRQSWQAFYIDAPGVTLADSVDVADVTDEQAHGYRWQNARPVQGFPTEYNQFQTLDCISDCQPMDGGRRINGEESFSVTSSPGRALFLVTRVHAGHTGTLDIYANDQPIAARVIPFLPGSWLEMITYIPAEMVTSAQTRIRIVPRLAEGDYMPYRHWVYESRYPVVFALCTDDTQVRYQDGAFSLNSTTLVQSADRLEVSLNWMNGQPGEAQASGDWIAFVHLYPVADLARVVTQTDRRPGSGTMPPGNWLPGMFEDTFVIDLNGVPPGDYRVAVGFYDPVDFTRLLPTLTGSTPADYAVTDDGRLFIATIRVP